MNKMYQAFDSIKLDEVIKKRAYQKLKEKTNKRTNTKLIYSISLAIAVFIFFITIFTNNIPQVDDNNDDVFTILESTNDIIMYNGNKYSISNDIDINTININKKIGVLEQIDSDANLQNNFESYYHDGYEVYNSNEDNVLIIKSNDDMLVYIKQ